MFKWLFRKKKVELPPIPPAADHMGDMAASLVQVEKFMERMVTNQEIQNVNDMKKIDQQIKILTEISKKIDELTQLLRNMHFYLRIPK